MAWLALTVFLGSCSSGPPVRDDSWPAATPPLYSLIFFVHGDASYTYHDALGEAREADDVVVSAARAIAEANPRAEVYIFHEIPRRHFLFIFPRRDGRAYHYRGGRLVAENSYWRDQGDSRFASALEFYGAGGAGREPPPTRMLFYFGHELPEVGGSGYDASYPDRKFTVEDFAGCARALAGTSGKLDLLVLGTCYGGTPHTIGRLAPSARYIIASPENLHLSYFDLQPLIHIGIDPDETTARFAKDFSRSAFERLASEVQTTVSVVLYDTEATQTYLDSVSDTYDRWLATADGMADRSPARCDCAQEAAYASPTMSTGLTVLYRAPNFGRMKNTPGHSGWECWRSVD